MDTMDCESLKLVIQLQREDLNFLEHSSKGKRRAGELSDSDLALEACRHEIELLASQVYDQIMAASISRAVETDGALIREARLAEEQAARDHEFAIRLSTDPNARAGPAAPEGKKTKECTDESDDDLINVLKSINLGNDQSLGQSESSSWAASRQPSKTRECIACGDQFSPLALSRSPCSHEYCRECLLSLISSSLQDESLFPPRCCGQNIPVKQGRWISAELVGQFRAKKLELETPNRTYCSEPSCSTFVPPAFIAAETATCLK
ncbi:hypothetical protein F53441_5048 [Fusarium austroafricanum]|uniref:RING-type domain-containing protein n=1 Tax=Fusarium austroafricanum TaxID=2364996 RepID=A0A8H4NY68_9HYPO|nr:hypothetical protein F53441_5048 [Fusarium austroafricanum]